MATSYVNHILAGYVGDSVTMINKCQRSNWCMDYLVKICHDVGVKNVGAFHWVIPGSVTKKRYLYRPLMFETNFNEFILKMPESAILCLYIKHKTNVDKGFRDIVEPKTKRTGDTVRLETIEPKSRVEPKIGFKLETNIEPNTKVRPQTTIEHEPIIFRSLTRITEIGNIQGEGDEVLVDNNVQYVNNINACMRLLMEHNVITQMNS